LATKGNRFDEVRECERIAPRGWGQRGNRGRVPVKGGKVVKGEEANAPGRNGRWGGRRGKEEL